MVGFGCQTKHDPSAGERLHIIVIENQKVLEILKDYIRENDGPPSRLYTLLVNRQSRDTTTLQISSIITESELRRLDLHVGYESIDNFSKIGETKTVNLLVTGPLSSGIVYGKLDLTYLGNNQVSIASNTYDFDTSDHPWFEGNFWRNVFTKAGEFNAGEGHPFLVNFSGVGYLNYNKYHDNQIKPQL